MAMNRSFAAQLARDTIRILEKRRYTNLAGEVVELGDLLDDCVQGVRSYPPDHDLPAVSPGATCMSSNSVVLTSAMRVPSEGCLSAPPRLRTITKVSGPSPSGGAGSRQFSLSAQATSRSMASLRVASTRRLKCGQ